MKESLHSPASTATAARLGDGNVEQPAEEQRSAEDRADDSERVYRVRRLRTCGHRD